MKKSDYRFVRVTENIEIPVPKNCTPEEEQFRIDEFKAQNDLAELEKEAQELERAIKEGSLMPLEPLLRELGIDSESAQESP